MYDEELSVPGTYEDNEDDAGTGSASVNWESDENPFYGRFKGLQSTVQKEVEARRQLESRLSQTEAMLMQAALADLPEEERAYRMQAWMQQQQAVAREQMLAAREQDVEQASKMAYAQITSQQYGVPVQKLLRFSNPDDMVTYAKDVFEERQKARKQGQKENRDPNADRFEGGTTTSKRPKEKFKSIEEAAAFVASLPDPRGR